MRSYVVILTLSLLACTYAEEYYSDKYDHIDIDKILANDRLRDQYYKCFVGAGPCVTADALFFKEYLPEAVATKCKKCTDMQKEKFDTIAEWYSTNRPDEWNHFIEVMMKTVTGDAANKE